VIVEEGLWDKRFVEERTEGFEELKESLGQYGDAYVKEITGISEDTLREVARLYAKGRSSSILYTMGITQRIVGTDNVLAIANLALLTGQIGKPHSGVNPLRGQNNVQGACDMGGLPDVYPGYQKVMDPEVSAKFEKAWGVKLDNQVGLTVGEMMDAAGEGKLKGMYIVGENPVLSDPDANHVVHSLEKLDFLVVQDIFLTETAKLAHVVLPAASFAEKEGTFTNTERRVQKVRQAIQPIGQCKPDWLIMAEVATAMGYPMEYTNSQAVFDEMRSLTPSYGGITYERLEKGSLQWPCPSTDHPGTVYLHQGKFSRGPGKFSVVDYLPPDEETCQEYPFVLSTGRKLQHYHTGTMTRRSRLEELLPEEMMEVHPEDAAKLGIVNGERVKVASRRGKVEVSVKITKKVPRGMVFATFHFWETAINKLTNPARDPKAKIPELKVCAVRLEKIS
jgi:formate dehydrogenase major subunit